MKVNNRTYINALIFADDHLKQYWALENNVPVSAFLSNLQHENFCAKDNWGIYGQMPLTDNDCIG